jgi:ubiquinone/menaquinone biosynthesis C-methylase UbiE
MVSGWLLAYDKSAMTSTDMVESLPKGFLLADKITRPFGEMLIEQTKIANIENDQKLVVLDDACGIGIISSRLMDILAEPVKQNLELTCLDISQPSVDYVRHLAVARDWKNVHVCQGDAEVIATALDESRFKVTAH